MRQQTGIGRNHRGRGISATAVDVAITEGLAPHARSLAPARKQFGTSRGALSVLAIAGSSLLVMGMAIAPVAAVSGTAPVDADPRIASQSLHIEALAAATAKDAFLAESAPVAAAIGRSAPAAGVPDPDSAQAVAYAMLPGWGWGESEYNCLVALWNRESHWNVYAHNSSSGAYGIPQALPGEKMASAGDDWATNPATQIVWGLGYISGRYGSPCGAWEHSEAHGWY